MPTPLPAFPTLNLRTNSPTPLTWQEGDENWENVRTYILALVAYVQGALNSDGTLVSGSVTAAALQAASVTLAALNPSLLYNIVPVNNDTGTTPNQYVITTSGGVGSPNIVPNGATYDANGNYVLNGLTLNYGYYWTPGANDISVQSTPAVTAAGAFQATATTILLTGSPNAPVTATVSQNAGVSQYKNQQIFFVWTTRANTGPATLNVNNLGAIPIQYYGAQLQAGQIGAAGVFAVVYMNGAFSVFVGATPPAAAQGGGATVITTTGYNGVNAFTAPSTALATSGAPKSILTAAHGLGSAPTQFAAVLQCTAPAGDSGFSFNQQIPLSQFTSGGSPNEPAFSWAFDGLNVYVSQLVNDPYVVNPSTGSAVQITQANWSLVVTASVFADYAGTAVFPALNYEVTNVHGAWCFGNQMFVAQRDASTNAYIINQVNLINNEITPVTTSSLNITALGNINGMVMPGSSGNLGLSYPVFVFHSTSGSSGTGYTGYIALQNPIASVITAGSAYNASGSFSVGTLSTTTATSYTWTPAANDTSLTVTNGTTTNVYSAYDSNGNLMGPISFSTTASGTWTGTLTGVAGTVITGTLYTTANVRWNPVLHSTSFNNSGYKPQWIDNNGYYYLVPSGLDQNTYSISSIPSYQVQATQAISNGTWPTQAGFGNNTANLNLTSSNIGNSAAFQAWSSTTGGNLWLFQYNPVSQRIYVITQNSGLGVLHIFQLGSYSNGVLTPLSNNSFATWWASASPGRENNLNYVKSLMLAGMGRVIGSWGQSHFTVDYDLSTGKERAIVFTRQGNDNNIGSITRIPWNE